METREELLFATGVKPKSGESEAALAKRVLAKVDKLPDEEWAKLSAEAQKWHNDAVDATEAGSDLPSLGPVANGDASEEAAEEAATEAEEETASEEAPKRAKSSSKKTAKGKSSKGSASSKASKPKAAKKASGEEGGTGRRGRQPSFTEDQKIKVLTKSPFKDGTKMADRFGKFKAGMTVKEALDADVPRRFIRRCIRDKHISVG